MFPLTRFPPYPLVVALSFMFFMISMVKLSLRRAQKPSSGVASAVSNIATMFSGGVPAWMACEGPRM